MTSHPPPTFRNLEDFAGIASDWFWETDQAHRFTYFSSRMEEVTHLRTADILGHRRDKLAADTDDPAWQTHLNDLMMHRPFRNFEYRVLRPCDGSELWLRVAGQPLFDSAGRFTGYRGTGHDITREKMAMLQLEQMNAALATRNRQLDEARHALEQAAFQDSLTGLPNRRAFELALGRVLAGPAQPIALLQLDLDRFKWVNDTLGHPCGDIVLTAAAARISTTVGDRGTVYRIGGDEFVILLTRDVTPEAASWTGAAVVDVLAEPFDLDQRCVNIGASVGVALGQAGLHDAAHMVVNADVALYEAKRNGRNRVCQISPQIERRMQTRRKLAAAIPAALAQGDFVAYFQPQADTFSGDIVGAEALVRWQHPERGLLQPAAFLDLAAELGLMADLDRLMLRHALDAADRLRDQGLALPSISVNISAARLIDPRLPDDVARFWTDRSCALSIELLETIYFDDRRENVQISTNLRKLRELGVEIYTDDFGSGRASITGLLKVRPDRLKIDRKLIRAAVKDPQQCKVVAAILEMTHALGIEGMAEGVETTDDVAVIRRIGCKFYQGNVLSPPLSEKDLAVFLAARAKGAKTKTAGQGDGLPLRA
jgi:diguanylate cyclase (GGDEF)-like protein/PAS domain S-box-containing protein